MIISVCTVPAAPGLRAAPSAAREPTSPCPIPARPAARPKPIPPPIAFAALTDDSLSAAPCAIAGIAISAKASVAKKTYFILFIFIYLLFLFGPSGEPSYVNLLAGMISPHFRYAVDFILRRVHVSCVRAYLL